MIEASDWAGKAVTAGESLRYERPNVAMLGFIESIRTGNPVSPSTL